MPGPLIYWDDLEVGRVFDLGSVAFDEESIVAFAREFDPQPFHVDRAAAEASMFGTIIASGWHTCSAVMRLTVDRYLNPEVSLGSPGMDEVRWPRPVRAGDTIAATLRCVDKRPSATRPFMGLVWNEWEARNGDGDVVLTMRGMGLFRRRPAV